MKKGQFSQYNWVECRSNDSLHKLLMRCPEFIIGKCLVISSFDSGPLMASPEELAKGWRQIGDLVIAPRIEHVEELPYDQHDEWSVFTSYTQPAITETFVNDGLFQLADPSSLLEDAVAATPIDADIVGAKYRVERLSERQQLFWEQIMRTEPESWVGNGDRLMFVTRNAELFTSVLLALRGAQ